MDSPESHLAGIDEEIGTTYELDGEDNDGDPSFFDKADVEDLTTNAVKVVGGAVGVVGSGISTVKNTWTKNQVGRKVAKYSWSALQCTVGQSWHAVTDAADWWLHDFNTEGDERRRSSATTEDDDGSSGSSGCANIQTNASSCDAGNQYSSPTQALDIGPLPYYGPSDVDIESNHGGVPQSSSPSSVIAFVVPPLSPPPPSSVVEELTSRRLRELTLAPTTTVPREGSEGEAFEHPRYSIADPIACDDVNGPGSSEEPSMHDALTLNLALAETHQVAALDCLVEDTAQNNTPEQHTCPNESESWNRETAASESSSTSGSDEGDQDSPHPNSASNVPIESIEDLPDSDPFPDGDGHSIFRVVQDDKGYLVSMNGARSTSWQDLASEVISDSHFSRPTEAGEPGAHLDIDEDDDLSDWCNIERVPSDHSETF